MPDDILFIFSFCLAMPDEMIFLCSSAPIMIHVCNQKLNNNNGRAVLLAFFMLFPFASIVIHVDVLFLSDFFISLVLIVCYNRCVVVLLCSISDVTFPLRLLFTKNISTMMYHSCSSVCSHLF